MRARALVAYNARRIRVERGISQERLAYDAGIDRSYMSGLERQQANPTVDLLDRLAETLGVAVSSCLFGHPRGRRSPRPYLKVASRTRHVEKGHSPRYSTELLTQIFCGTGPASIAPCGFYAQPTLYTRESPYGHRVM